MQSKESSHDKDSLHPADDEKVPYRISLPRSRTPLPNKSSSPSPLPKNIKKLQQTGLTDALIGQHLAIRASPITQQND